MVKSYDSHTFSLGYINNVSKIRFVPNLQKFCLFKSLLLYLGRWQKNRRGNELDARKEISPSSYPRFHQPTIHNIHKLFSSGPSSIYQYSNMARRLLGQNDKSFKVSFVSQFPEEKTRREYKEITTKYKSFSWRPRNHARILIYPMWPIRRLLRGVTAIFKSWNQIYGDLFIRI